jgi:threonine aldolase
MVDRLPEDHQRARTLAETIAEYPAYRIKFDTVQTNLVIFKTMKPQDEVIAALKDRGVLASNMGDRGIRMVTHYQITDEHIDRTIAALKDIAHA